MDRPPFAISALDHVVLRVNDLPLMLGFYRDVLGCTLERQQPAIGLWQLRAGTALIDLLDCSGPAIQIPAAARQPNMDHLCLRLQTWDEPALRAWLAQHGIEAGLTVMRYGAQGRGPSIYIQDPEHNRVELKAP